MQQLVTELRAKRAAGTITTDELAWLLRAEQRGGPCITGTPRGPGAGNGMGQRHRRGLRDGTGPRNVDDTCPLGNTPQQRGRQ